MGRAPANNLDCKVMPEDSDFAYDVRLARRWKRRYVANNSFKNNSYSDTIKKTLDGVRKREGTVDDGFETFFSAAAVCSEDNSAEDDDVDPQYEMFLKHLREDGKSYVLDITINDEMSICIKYHEEDVLDNELKQKNSKTMKNIPSGEKIGTPNDLRNVLSKGKMETPETVRSVLSNERNRAVVQKNLKPGQQDFVSCGTNRPSSQKPSPRVPSSPKLKSKHKTGYGLVDDSYEVFLSCLSQDGFNLVLTTEDGKKCKYEEYDEIVSDSDSDSDSDSEIVARDSAPYFDEGQYTPFVTSKLFDSSEIIDVDDSCMGRDGGSNCSQFREKLMHVLSMPYEQNEFEELMREASDRKPLERHRDLRGRIITYSLESVNKSYLDHYNELAKKIDSVQGDRQRILNLLRGFFYWLKNLSHEGVFRPWLDEQCLKALPRK